MNPSTVGGRVFSLTIEDGWRTKRGPFCIFQQSGGMQPAVSHCRMSGLHGIGWMSELSSSSSNGRIPERTMVVVGEEPGTSCSLVEWVGYRQVFMHPKLIFITSGSMCGVMGRGEWVCVGMV